MNGRPHGPSPAGIDGISIDSRTVGPGDAFFAIRGDRFDGHDFVAEALARRRGDGGRRRGPPRRARPGHRVAGRRRGRARGARPLGRGGAGRGARRGIVAVTGSVGKTGTKEMLARALAGDGPVHYSPASFNNHWGVPLTLARMPADGAFRHLRDRHEPCRRDRAADADGPARMSAIVTTVEPVHLEYFESVEGIARAKAEIFLGVEPGGAAIINRDNPHYALLARLAREAGVERVDRLRRARGRRGAARRSSSSSPNAPASRRRSSAKRSPTSSAPRGGTSCRTALPCSPRSRCSAATSPARSSPSARMAPPKGRGERHRLAVGGGTATLIDESYNANPASMRAAIALLGQAEPVGEGPADRRPRRHARARAGRRRRCTPASPSPLAEAADRPRLSRRPADGDALGCPSRKPAGRPMPKPPPNSNRGSRTRSARATWSWSRDRMPAAWDRWSKH